MTPTTPQPRQKLLTEWISNKLGDDKFEMVPLAGDAGSRSYYRVVRIQSQTIIAMNAPTTNESVARFAKVTQIFARAQLRVPELIAVDEELGFCLLEDFGDSMYETVFSPTTINDLYSSASKAIIKIQSQITSDGIGTFDAALVERELTQFPEWYCDKLLGKPLTEAEEKQYAKICQILLEACLEQPQLAMHRDYHSRNLFALENGPGIIDFQDAMVGPINYDIGSLLRDLYVEIDPAQELDLLVKHWLSSKDAGLPVTKDFGAYYKQYEYNCLQRYVKLLGQFVRLSHQRNIELYLSYLPRCKLLTHATAMRYRDLRPLALMIQERE